MEYQLDYDKSYQLHDSDVDIHAGIYLADLVWPMLDHVAIEYELYDINYMINRHDIRTTEGNIKLRSSTLE